MPDPVRDQPVLLFFDAPIPGRRHDRRGAVGMSGARQGRRFTPRRAGAGIRVIAGYASSMVLLAAASLSAIPAMVSASGATVWGMIAVGQSIGGVGATIIGYGWGLSGPAMVARSGPVEQRTEYAESALAKMALAVPVIAVACLLAWFVGGELGIYSAVGALSMGSVGLTANWFFVGLGRPFGLLLFETVPRVIGTVVGIAFMRTGSDALVGIVWQLNGMLMAFLVCSVWILRPWRRGALSSIRRRPTRLVLGAQRHGVVSTVISSLYASLPIVIVSVVAPIAQPTYAVVEKVQRQVIVGLGPFVTFLQGWVPRAPRGGVIARVRTGLVAASVFSALLGAGMLIVAPELVGWLGNGQITPSFLTLTLMSVITGVSLYESVVSKACLAALGRLDVVAKYTAISSLVGLPLVALGAFLAGAPGALGGILAGLVLRLLLELFGLRSAMRSVGVVTPTSLRNPSIEVEETP